MKILAAFLFSSVALAAPVPLTEVGVELDINDADRLAGTGNLILKQAVPETTASSAVKMDLRCVLPITVAVRGKVAMVPVPNAPAAEKGAKRYLSLGYFSKDGQKVAPLTEGKLADLAGDFTGKLVENRTHFVNGKHAALALPVKQAGYSTPKLTVTLAKTDGTDGLCEEIRKNGFRVQR